MKGVFKGCVNLKSVVLPKSLKNIGEDAFKNCPSLNEIYYEGSESDWKNIDYYEYITGTRGDNWTYFPESKGKLTDHFSDVGLPANVVIHYNYSIPNSSSSGSSGSSGSASTVSSTVSGAAAIVNAGGTIDGTASKYGIVAGSGKIKFSIKDFSPSSYNLTGDTSGGIKISKKWVLKAKKSGSYDLTLTDASGNSREFQIYVDKPKMKKKTVTSAGSFDITEMLSGVSNLTPTSYETSNQSVASISGDGTVTVSSKGKAKITVYFGNKKYSAQLKAKF